MLGCAARPGNLGVQTAPVKKGPCRMPSIVSAWQLPAGTVPFSIQATRSSKAASLLPGISSLLSLEGRGGRRCFDRERLVIKPTPAVRFGCVLAHGESRFRRDKTPSPKVDFAAEILSLDLIA